MKLFIKAQLYTLLFLLLFFFLTFLGVVALAYSKYTPFEQTTGLSVIDSYNLVKKGLETPINQTSGQKNILILGLDSLSTRGDSPPLTDTIIVARLNLEKGSVATVSLPRDLWHEEYQTRINALYFYGQERYPQTPEQFPTEVISELMGIEIHETVVLSFSQVSQLIDILGGIEVDVPVGFVDETFPRTDVDVTVERDPAKLYKTVEFTQGKQIMSGETALEYIRSRKSGDDEGTDIARGSRQQLVIQAIISKLKQKETLTNFELLGKLYNFYQENFSEVISVEELIAIGKKLYPVKDTITFNAHSIPVYPEQEEGVIWHPPTWQYKGEWVYAVREDELFKEFIQSSLGQTQ
jgi:LCP family protein required for cell wall assembly